MSDILYKFVDNQAENISEILYTGNGIHIVWLHQDRLLDQILVRDRHRISSKYRRRGLH